MQKIDLKKSFVFIEGASKKKSGGKEFQVPIHASNVQIVEFNLNDQKRINALKKKGIAKTELRKLPAEESEMKETKTKAETKKVEEKKI